MKKIVLLSFLVFALVFASQAEVDVQFSWKKFKNRVSGGLKKAGKKIGNAAKKAGKKIKNAAKKAGKKIKNAAKKAGKKIKNAFKSLPKPKRATHLTVPLLAAHASHAAYVNREYLYSNFDFDNSKFLTTLDTNAGRQRIVTKVLVNDQLNLVVVAIRGTVLKEFSDIVANFKLKLVNCNLQDKSGATHTYGKVHKGFWNDVKQQFSMVKNAVKPLVEKGYGLLVTGHSQGAAEATIMALYLALQFPQVNKNNFHLITFGSPRVGNKAFGTALNNRISLITRYITKAKGIGGSDPITKVPPAIKYNHVGPGKKLYCSKLIGFACHPIAKYIAGLGGLSRSEKAAVSAVHYTGSTKTTNKPKPKPRSNSKSRPNPKPKRNQRSKSRSRSNRKSLSKFEQICEDYIV